MLSFCPKRRISARKQKSLQSKRRAPNTLCCKTKYPLVLVHGVGFRDTQPSRYWGRIPETLRHAGATVYLTHQDAWGTIETNAQTVKQTVLAVLQKTGAEKVNVLAHSKGGLDARYMISALDMHSRVASLTTFSTPHHGSKTMDFILTFPSCLFKGAAIFVNRFYKRLGDENPDFYNACQQFTTARCAAFNQKITDCADVYYQSYVASMQGSWGNLIRSVFYYFVNQFDGPNDGLVSIASARWGRFRGVLQGNGRRGVSHIDIIDMRKKDVAGIEILKIYKDIVRELKEKGF